MKLISMNSTPMRCFICCLFLISSIQAIGQTDKQGPWQQYSQAEEAGFSSEKLELAKAQYDQMRSASFMVIHKGHVLLAWDDVSRRYMTHSMRKSLMSAMYGIYEGQGKVNLQDKLKELGIDDIQGLTDTEKQARVLDLITARSGIYHPAAYEPRSMKRNRPERGVSKPGEQFNYNNWDFNTLLTILEQQADIRFFEEFNKQIAIPLGMEDLRATDMRYRFEPELSKHAAYLFKMSARDLARFGQLYLNNGRWNARQIIPADWVAKSTAAFSTELGRFSNRGGYGYLWWVDHSTFDQPSYSASGLGGHKIIVLPESDMVIVHQVNTYLAMAEREDNIKQLVKLVLEAKTGEAKTRPALKALSFKQNTYSSKAVAESTLKAFEGKYRHRFFQKMEIYLQDGQLKAKGEVLGNFRLFAQGEGRFVIEDLPELPMQFIKSDAEHPKGTSVTQANEQGRPQAVILYY